MRPRLAASRAVLLLCALFAVPLAAQARLSRPVIDTVDHHIVRVTNSGPTAWTDTNGWKLVYQRTVQPPEGSPGMLQNPSALLLLPDGRLIVIDNKATTVNLYGANGSWIRALGRRGEGPGEYHAIEGALLRDTLFIQDYLQGRGTVMTFDGRVVRTFPTPCCFGYPATADDHGRLHVYGAAANHHGQILTLSADGTRLDSLPEPAMKAPRQWTTHTVTNGMSSSATFNVPMAPENRDVVRHSGAVVFGSTDSLDFVETSHGTDTLRRFNGPAVTPVEIPRGVRDSLYHLYTDHNAALRAVASESDIPENYPVWRDMAEDGGGDLWVLTGAGAGLLTRFAVFDPAGRFLGWVASPPIRYLGQTAWSSDHMAVIDTDDNDLPRIRIFRIDRRGH